MKKLLTFCFCCVAVSLSAQISISQADMPSPGDTLRYSNANPVGVNYSQTGANQFWDYSNLSAVGQGREDYVYSLQTIYAFYFLGTNQYGTKIADTVGGGPFTFTNVYNFFRSASSDFRAEGVGFRSSGIPLAAYYSDEDELFKFPMEYGDRDTSTYKFSVDLGNGTRFSQQGTRINHVDGWGSIKTPWDSLACLRLVSTTNGVDSVYFNGFSLGLPRIAKSYKFMANGVKIPVLEIIGNTQNGQYQVQQVKYRDDYQTLVAVQAPIDDQIRVFPNPAANNTNLVSIDQKPIGYQLMNVTGQILAASTSNSAWHQIDLSKFPAGIYFIKISNYKGLTISTERIVVGN